MSPRVVSPRSQRGWADTLALRLFVLIWVALVISHVAAYALVHAVSLRPMDGPPPADRRADFAAPPSGERPPLPTFPSLPPTPGMGPPAGAPPQPGGLPLGALLLDYGVRLVFIGAAAWWGSRWLVRPVNRLIAAAQALGPALAAGQRPAPLDERQGSREVQATASVFNTMSQQIQQLFRSRGLMIAAISHDLRTPLTRMRLRAETSPLPDELRLRLVADLREMNALIDTVLEVFREPDVRAAAPQRTDLTALAQALVDDRVEAGAQVRFEGLPAVALADPLALRRVLGNLVDNALRYAGHAEVQVLDDPACSHLRVQVLDRGPGIPQDQLESVLQPFTRVEGSRAPETGGTGLGLFIASELTRRMNGRLQLAARPGGGLQATLELPRG